MRRRRNEKSWFAWRPAWALFVVAALVPLLGACATDPSVNQATYPGAAQLIAFESIDGPPRPIFDRFVSALRAEAEVRNLPVVSRTANATVRVRAYLATHVQKRQATLSWVWDVFDARSQRAFRISGEEALGPARGDVWAQCDEAVLGQIAARGFDLLTSRLGPNPQPAPAGPSDPGGVATGSAGPTAVAAAGQPD